jgi:hypothetical protein
MAFSSGNVSPDFIRARAPAENFRPAAGTGAFSRSRRGKDAGASPDGAELPTRHVPRRCRRLPLRPLAPPSQRRTPLPLLHEAVPSAEPLLRAVQRPYGLEPDPHRPFSSSGESLMPGHWPPSPKPYRGHMDTGGHLEFGPKPDIDSLLTRVLECRKGPERIWRPWRPPEKAAHLSERAPLLPGAVLEGRGSRPSG